MIPVVQLFGVVDTEFLQDVSKCYDAEHDARVGATDNGKNFVAVFPHSRQRATQRQIVVDVG